MSTVPSHCISFRQAVLLAIALAFFACSPEVDREAQMQALVEQTVAERVATYERVRLQRCREEVLEEANRRLDSILIEQATLQAGTGMKPPRPNRPGRPDIRQLEDTLPLKPLLPTDSIPQRDTIQEGRNQ